MGYRLVGCLLGVAIVSASQGYAQEQAATNEEPRAPIAGTSPADASVPVLRGIRIDSGVSTFAPEIAASSSVRRKIFASAPGISMYAAYGVFQALDVHSTLRALEGDAVEANPLVRPFASSPVGLVSLKLATGAGVLYLMERVRKKNPTAAFVLAIGVNCVQAFVVAHNYRVARR